MRHDDPPTKTNLRENLKFALLFVVPGAIWFGTWKAMLWFTTEHFRLEHAFSANMMMYGACFTIGVFVGVPVMLLGWNFLSRDH